MALGDLNGGVAQVELIAVIDREYMRVMRDPGAGIHPMAERWKDNENMNRAVTAHDPFRQDRSFEQNFDLRFPEKAATLRQAVRQQEQASEAQTLDRQRYIPPGDRIFHRQHEEGADEIRNRIADAMRIPGHMVNEGMVQDIGVHQHQAYQAMGVDYAAAPTETLETKMIEFLTERHDIAEWMDNLSEKLGTNMEETIEIALRMAMEIAFKENEAQMAGLNKKLQDMEEGRDDS